MPGRQFGVSPAALGAVACIALLPLFAHAADSTAVDASWSWSAPETLIRFPKFSPDGKTLVAEVRYVVSNSAFFSEKVFNKRYGKKLERDPRFGDPTIALIRIADGTRQDLGYGFEPVFSPDGRHIAFEQLKPPPKFVFYGYDTKPRASNGLAVYDLDSKQLRRVAEPTTSHCIRPIFTPDGKSLVFGTPQPDSAFRSADPETLERVDLATGTRTTLYARQETRGKPHFLREFAFVGERLLARRGSSVAQPGPFELIRLEELIDPASAAVVYSWGEVEYPDYHNLRFARWRDGTLAVFTRQWAPLASKPIHQPRKDSFELLPKPGVLSPNGLLVARADDFAVVVEDLVTGKEVATYDATPDGIRNDMLDLTWSADSKRIAWVDSGTEEPQGHDVLRVETLPEK